MARYFDNTRKLWSEASDLGDYVAALWRSVITLTIDIVSIPRVRREKQNEAKDSFKEAFTQAAKQVYKKDLGYEIVETPQQLDPLVDPLQQQIEKMQRQGPLVVGENPDQVDLPFVFRGVPAPKPPNKAAEAFPSPPQTFGGGSAETQALVQAERLRGGDYTVPDLPPEKKGMFTALKEKFAKKPPKETKGTPEAAISSEKHAKPTNKT